jgi:hypothetical protein
MSAAEKLEPGRFTATLPRTRAGSKFHALADEAAVEALKVLLQALRGRDPKLQFQAARDLAFIRSRLTLDPAALLSGADGEQRERVRALLRGPTKEFAEDLEATGWTRKASP